MSGDEPSDRQRLRDHARETSRIVNELMQAYMRQGPSKPEAVLERLWGWRERVERLGREGERLT